ncbi:MAG: hypothetical protein OHK0012_17180 [Synechococcales cyanobacterium]
MGIPADVAGETDHFVISGLTQECVTCFVQPLPGAREEDPITLDALQYLTNTLLNLHQEEHLQQSYTLDVAGYRQQRWADLQSQAVDAITNVRSGHEEYVWVGLSSAERRQVHSFLQSPDYEDLESFSRGKEPQRHLVIRRRDPQS